MYSNKKSTKVGSNIFVNEASANVDYKYGPYPSINEAYNTLGEDNLDVIAIGLTVGIMTEDGVVEYWFKSGTSKEDLVVKNGGGSDEGLKELVENNHIEVVNALSGINTILADIEGRLATQESEQSYDEWVEI